MLTPQNHYKEVIQKYSKKKEKLKKQSLSTSMTRLMLFVIFIALTYFTFGSTGYFLLTLIIFSAFGYLMKVHQKLSYKIKWFETGIELAKNEIKAIKQDYSAFNGGEEFKNPKHPYSSDLDLFGEGSIFQMLNRTTTPNGKKILAKWMTKVDGAETIIKRQKAVDYLDNHQEWITEFKTTGLMESISENELQQIIAWCESDESATTYPKWLSFIALGLFTSTCIGTIFFNLTYWFPLGIFLINLGLIAQKAKQFNVIHVVLGKQTNTLTHSVKLLQKTFELKHPKGRLKKIHEELKSDTAKKKIDELFSMINLLDARFNVVVATLFNGIFLFDNWVICDLNEWKKANGKKLQNWLEALGEVDALVSLATYSVNHPNYVTPEIKEKFSFRGINLTHPLLPEASSVGNDFVIDKSNDLFLITGSNMAGKSTFLRTVGVNMILAQAGTNVCAKSFTYSPMEIFTSMRIIDSIQSGASTFFAEVNRIRQIIETAQNRPIFVLLDEILKGTNSKDKYMGSKALIKQLSKYNTCGIIASHDLKLGELSDSLENLHNRRFEVEIIDGEFKFDYKIKEGVCQTMNATELMRKMGIEV